MGLTVPLTAAIQFHHAQGTFEVSKCFIYGKFVSPLSDRVRKILEKITRGVQ